MMTNKHFTAIAKALHTRKPKDDYNFYSVKHTQWLSVVVGLADELKRFNPRFNKQRFIDEARNGLDKQ